MDGGGRLSGALKGRVAKALNLDAWKEAWADRRAMRAAQRRGHARRFDVPRGIGSAAALAIIATFSAIGFNAGGHYDQFQRQYGSVSDIAARLVGLNIASVSVVGNRELSVEEVFAAAAMPATASLPFLDIAAVQERLKRIPLIDEVSVRKLYPNRLAIDITERTAFALWQKDGSVQVVSADGTAIDSLRDDRFITLPHVVGNGANKRVRDYVGILLEVPEIAPLVRAGTLVGERRWNLKLKNGIDVKLPEEEPAKALARLAEIDRDTRLLSRDIIGVDLRQPDRITVRVTEDAAQARYDSLEKRIEKLKRRG
ncbi:MAG: FtsQ-type POTRA domain-containing protein [Proteobacteria bacterium]|nr:FtsQ-type POTRA domain-containing protein [Pseudomonadota bacterium]